MPIRYMLNHNIYLLLILSYSSLSCDMSGTSQSVMTAPYHGVISNGMKPLMSIFVLRGICLKVTGARL